MSVSVCAIIYTMIKLNNRGCMLAGSIIFTIRVLLARKVYTRSSSRHVDWICHAVASPKVK